MRHTLINLARALFATWFILVSAEVPGVHKCAVHSAHAAGHSHTASHNHSQPKKPQSHEGRCTCLGAQCTTDVFTSLAAVPTVRASVAILVDRKTNLSTSESFAPPAQVRIPFANGPPGFDSAYSIKAA